MPTIVSKTGQPVVELGDWVDAQANPAYSALMTAHAEQMAAGAIVPSAEFDAMFVAFMTATNQEVIG